ncbi:hypothetical protein [Schaalia hyovaginalis]|uniref:hypothetical protein n=1 Tax=Schaalia hyovaginalis TaxID=29316 RepID=UPI002A75951D|nr:hypothetical protein [Schaalia hyovaginalis]MDY2669770.1 hypothetical protein [Schaalia hyovaginalis]
MAHLNAANALMFGSEDDSFFLGDGKIDLTSVVALDTQLPAGLEDVGWIGEDGMTVNMSDSVDKIRGHQNHGVVKTYMSDSSSGIEVVVLESKLKTFLAYFDATAKKVGSIARIEISAARKARTMTAVIDAFDTSDSSIQWRVLLPSLQLGAREGVPLKIGELTAYKFSFEILDGFQILTNAPALIPAG